MSRLRTFPKYYYGAMVAFLLVVAGLAYWQISGNQKDASWARATEFYTKADYENANKELQGLGVPTSADRLRVYSQTKLATRDLDAALDGYQKLYAIDKDASYQLIIGNIYNEKKQYDDAIKIYRDVISTNPANAQAYVNLSTLYKLRGNTSEAIAVANEGVKNNPGSVTLRELQVSMLLDDKGSSQYKDAVNGLRSIAPNDPLLQTLK